MENELMAIAGAAGDPQPSEARKALVDQWQKRVTLAKKFWQPAFSRMREDMAFAAGKQWPNGSPASTAGAEEEQYVANIVLRHIQQTVSSLYGKNPRTIAKRKKMLLSTVWDGSAETVMMAQQQAQMAMEAGAMPDPQTMAILQEAAQVQQHQKMLDKLAETLVLLYEHNIEEQIIPFKTQLKGMVRRSLTTGVGYVKLGFQRVMSRRPEVEQQIADAAERLSTIERLSKDMASGDVSPDDAEADQLQLTLKALQEDQPIIVREGLTFDYPDSTAVIPDPKCKQLRGFVGARWVAEEYFLTRDDIMEIYGVDVGEGSAKTYTKTDAFSELIARSMGEGGEDERTVYCVYQVYSRSDGLVYTLCDGHQDFLEEPHAPEPWLERFWPWFVYAKNEVYHEGSVFPPSDVRLIRDAQMELNRARQGLREHRRANRPKTIAPAGMLDEEDKAKLQSHPANALIELQALQPGQSVDSVLQAFKGPPIDPALYDTNPAFEDVLRVVGQQEANLGGTSGATATETSIAESARMTASGSSVDDLDEMLTELSRAAGQVLLSEMSADIVKELIGPGAVWPELNREVIAREVYLEIEAASTGRPNKAAEVQNFTQLAPIMMQIPGISPAWLAKEAVRRLDDRLDVDEAIMAGLPSMALMNRQAQTTAAPAGQDPNQQAPEGAGNTPDTNPDQVNAAPRQQQPNVMDPNVPTGQATLQ
jgi:hypothetical protein